MTSLTLNREAIKQKELREKRKALLEAWDIAKSNIIFGIDSVDADRQFDLIQWYKAILDLNEEAFDEIPDEVSKYLH